MPALSPRLPLLRLNEKHILRIRSTYRFHTMSGSFIKNGGFKIPTSIIDSDMREYKILRIHKKRLSISIVDIFGWIERKFWYKVEYDLSDPVQLSFDDVKTKIIELVVRKRWYAQGGESRAEFIKAFEAFSDMKELISHISAYGDPPF